MQDDTSKVFAGLFTIFILFSQLSPRIKACNLACDLVGAKVTWLDFFFMFAP